MHALLSATSNVFTSGLGPFGSSSGSSSSGSGSVPPNLSVSSSGGDIFGFLGGLIVVVVVLALLGVFVLIVVANRADPDPTGRRPRAVYHFFVAFVTVLTAVSGSVLGIWSLFRLVGSHDVPLGDATARALVLGGLITVVSLVLLSSHLGAGLELARASTDPADPSRRVSQSYVSAVSFVFVLVVLVTSIISVYLVISLIGPGVFGSFGGRSEIVRDLLDSVYLALVSAFVLNRHRDMLPPGLWSTAGTP